MNFSVSCKGKNLVKAINEAAIAEQNYKKALGALVAEQLDTIAIAFAKKMDAAKYECEAARGMANIDRRNSELEGMIHAYKTAKRKFQESIQEVKSGKTS